jgi:ABC-2 type transport system permease protein
VTAARFSVARWWSIVLKEFLQLRRDRLTFAMIIAIPIVQICLFGFAINTDPKHLPAAVLGADQSEFTRSIAHGLENSAYFDLVAIAPGEAAARAALAAGRVMFVLDIPADFTRRLLRGEHPALILEADATDPQATAAAVSVAAQLPAHIAAHDLPGPLARLAGAGPPFAIEAHSLYNPEAISQYNIVPGLMGVILTLTMVLMTGLAMTRERERGTMENLLATPVLPLEVIAGKILPYVAIGLIQCAIILAASRWVFHVPFRGSFGAIFLGALAFIAATLTVGITLSSLAQNQLQAMQLTMFYFLPNMLLTGFMFPFRGMPHWAQMLGGVLPLTYFNRMVRGILLKGNGWADLWPNLWPILLFTAVFMAIAVKFYRRTLD